MAGWAAAASAATTRRRRTAPASSATAASWGFPLAAIRELLDLTDDPGRSCAAVDAVARSHLAQVERRIRRLQSLKDELERMIDQCQGCTICDCHVIEVLADASHAHCLSDDHQGSD